MTDALPRTPDAAAATGATDGGPGSGRTRWVGVGASSASSGDAATEAIAQATAGRVPQGVLLFCSPWQDLPAVARAAQASLPDDVPVVGCTTSGEIAGLAGRSGSVVAVALGGSGLTVRVALGSLADGARTAGEDAARCLLDVDSPHRVLILLSDGLGGARAEVVRGAYGVTGATVPMVGGCAGDELAMVSTHQLYRGEVLTGTVVGLALGSDAPIGVGIGHGWRRFGPPAVVTESDGQWIYRLDDELALDHYLTAIGAAPAVFDDPALGRDAMLYHPFGLIRPGSEEVRAILDANYADRSLFCADVPQGTVVSMMEGSTESVLAGTRVAAEQAVAALGGADPIGLIAFDCTARRIILGTEHVPTELAIIAESAPGVPIGGFYTYGEFARTSGARGIHNATLVLLALA